VSLGGLGKDANTTTFLRMV